MNKIKIGTRGSILALFQAQIVKKEFAEKGFDSEIIVIETKGSMNKEKPLYEMGEKGIFVKEIENSLAKGEIDAAVHSLKDLPGEIDSRLEIGAYLKREEPRDVFISSKHKSFKDVPENAKIATGSIRRKSQIKKIKKNAEIIPMRGNVDTRIKKAEKEDLDGAIMAAAGVIRIGKEAHIKEKLSYSDFTPTPGQGIVAVEIRKEDSGLKKAAGLINVSSSEICYKTERDFLNMTGGGCFLPIGALCIPVKDGHVLFAYIGDVDGERVLKEKIHFSGYDEKNGKQLAEKLLSSGGREILDELRE